MKLRFEIKKKKRKVSGVRTLRCTIRYWWPARKGEHRRTKVDPKAFADAQNATTHAVEMLRKIEDHEVGRGPDPFADTPRDLGALVERFLALLAAGEFVTKMHPRVPSEERVRRVRQRLALLVDRFGFRTVGDFMKFGPDASL